MTVQICQKMRGMGGMASKKKRVRPFRVLAMLMGAGTLAMLMRFPAKAVSLERQQAQLVEAAQAYGEAQSANNRLKANWRKSGRRNLSNARRAEITATAGTARSSTGGNLDEIEQQLEFDVYGQD